MTDRKTDDAERTWEHGDTRRTTTAADTDSAETSSRVPSLTLIAHPDRLRVGETLALPALALGQEVLLSRLQPVFHPPASPPGSAGRPLADRSVSRRPIRLIPGDESGSVIFDFSDTSTRVFGEDGPLQGRHAFSLADLQRGVVLLVGRHIAVLLGLTIFPRPPSPPRYGLIGESDAMLELREELRHVAKLDLPVLLRGESGTGKELAARALHDNSPRSDGPWTAVNMATLSPTLAAAELFGAVRGAYTGADRKKDGFFQSAQGGTLFLDEIGEAPPEVQVMLLRTLENHEVLPVGSTTAIPVDVRVIAATDAKLEQAMKEGRFRVPLYHRLAGYTVRLPPLRRRRDDIARLLHFFLEQDVDLLETGDKIDLPSARTIARLTRHHWPGNVRELRNVARQLAIRPGTSLEDLLKDLPHPSSPSMPVVVVPETPSPVAAASVVEKSAAPQPAEKRRLRRRPDDVGEDELIAALEEHGYRMRETAEALNLSRMNFYRRIEQSPDVRKAADLELPEIEDALARTDGDLADAALALRVSLQGLKFRMTALGVKR